MFLILAFLSAFSGNLLVSVGRQLTLAGKYDDSQVVLSGVSGNYDYNEYCYLCAVNAFALNDKKSAEKWVKDLLESFEPRTARQEALGLAMAQSLKDWKSGDLSDIERDMRKSADRLGTARAGKVTEGIQREIVAKLDRLIKEEEDKGKGGGEGKPGEKEASGKGKPAEGQVLPAPDSRVMGGSGVGRVDEQQLRKIAESWGTLPPEKRAAVVRELTQSLPPKFEPMIKNYFESLNKMYKK